MNAHVFYTVSGAARCMPGGRRNLELAPLSNVPGLHLGEMVFVTVTPDEMDVFFSAFHTTSSFHARAG